MAEIVVFGAGGRAGRLIAAGALGRGHRVTGVARGPVDLGGVTVVVGDVTDAGSVATAAAGHGVAIVSVYAPEPGLYDAAATALLEALPRAGVRRLVVITTGTVLEVAPGMRFHDQPSFPDEFRPFSEARARELDRLRADGADLDWVAVAGPPTLLADGPGTGAYRVAVERLAPYDTPDGPSTAFPYAPSSPPLRYADLALAAVDEATDPRHHHVALVVHP